MNGELFNGEDIEIPRITEEIRDLILEKASDDFNWNEISPTIFGAVFESTLNPETRRKGGMHYTSIENIHKVIDPLFYDDLCKEFEEIKNIKVTKTRNVKIEEFRDKLAGLTFLDPACGSGNFLTETYLSLRRLENEAIELMTNGQMILGDFIPIKVQISQFYGIEINDFAVTVAKTALWIAESQMMQKTEEIMYRRLEFLPLKSYTNIVEGNALRVDWNEVVPAEKLNYIMGNPPFIGARMKEKSQAEDMDYIFKDVKNYGNLDYVAAWYMKAAKYIQNTNIECAFVSTNSISQGEQVAILWRPLMEKYGIIINFAHTTFIWDSEASLKAHVHCVIIGFALNNRSEKKIYYEGKRFKKAKNINGYLINAENIFIDNHQQPICKDAPIARSGNKPIDGGNYLFTPDEYRLFISREPNSKKYFKKWIGAQEYINNEDRYVLYLRDAQPQEIKSMPLVLERVQKVADFRRSSKSAGTRAIANAPTRFHVETILKSAYLVMPLTSSERRKYVPVGFMEPSVIPSNLVVVISNAELFHFGIITSNVFMSWMRVVCGRLKSDYRITKDNVYNNFPWPVLTKEHKEKIKRTAQAILDARAKYPDSSLADLYDEALMPSDLRNAHLMNDKAVMDAYGFTGKIKSESECVAELMKMYQELVNN